jgi:hypothetical protein
MAELVNLKRIRKQKERAERSAAAEQNRIRFGRSKADRAQTQANDALATKRLERHKLEK